MITGVCGCVVFKESTCPPPPQLFLFWGVAIEYIVILWHSGDTCLERVIYIVGG